MTREDSLSVDYQLYSSISLCRKVLGVLKGYDCVVAQS